MKRSDGREWLVMKFGGTSVRDAVAMRGVVDIVRDEVNLHAAAGRPVFPVVVASACAGVTDDLLACAHAVGTSDTQKARSIQATLRDRHHDILLDLDPAPPDGVRRQLDNLLNELARLIEGVSLLDELTPRSIDLFASLGERMSTLLLAHAFEIGGIPTALLDSRDVIVTDDRHTDARPIMDEIDRRAPDVLSTIPPEARVIVAQGFIGRTRAGETTTIGRGGSDHTGALLGGALRTFEIQIWTDVSGILTADPRIVPDARVVEQVTFSEARELATFGAKVLHPDTIVPAVQRGIPVVIRNSMRPGDPGTRILPDDASLSPGVHSISARRGLRLLRLTPRRMTDRSGPLAAPQVFASHDVPLLLFQLVESSGVAVVPDESFSDVVLADLEERCHVELTNNVALLCLCGVGIDDRPDGLAEAIKSLKGRSVPIAASGPSKYVHLLVIDEHGVADAVATVHRRLFAAEQQPSTTMQ